MGAALANAIAETGYSFGGVVRGVLMWGIPPPGPSKQVVVVLCGTAVATSDHSSSSIGLGCLHTTQAHASPQSVKHKLHCLVRVR
ncbi:hypothetical protein DMN91_012563 [Ooceraea biroi]|uniref:Uncharacterized protein n=1 Tax=Ooceraea biroi TaxID=2015173 RepID=A0A3L8D5R1_OOCBI|nr:hypothetical protein DMN91_012563 [Ooceraea biroi]